MVIEKVNKKLEIINKSNLEGASIFHLKDCIIDKLDLEGAFELETQIILENCIIHEFMIHSCWFTRGLIVKNCVVNNSIDYQMGGHNQAPIVFERNIFNGFFNFFDCQFNEIIEFKDNILKQGTNLLGNTGEGYENNFESGCVVENNLGVINMDIV